MNRYVPAAAITTLMGIAFARALTTQEIAGTWEIATVGTNYLAPVGDVSWKTIAFSSNTVAWAWIRAGEPEEYKGTFLVVPEARARPGMYQAFRIEITPTIPRTAGSIVLKDVRYGMDSRFPPDTPVLKFSDDRKAYTVFVRKRE